MDDDQRNLLLLNWTYSYQDKSLDELRLAMELEEARLRAEDDLRMRDEQILHLKELLCRAIKERDEAQEKCQKLFLDKIFLQQKLQQPTPHSAISSIEDDPRRGIDGFSSSDCDESIVSSPETTEEEEDFPVPTTRPLPEKGKLLQAVMKAGPLLQTLLLAGPLPQWRHPPPPVDACQIPAPPVVVPPPSLPTVSAPFLHQDSLLHNNINICGRITRKRGLPECVDSSNELKYQRLVLQ